ncbi:MAG: carbohydrate kinase family protein [Armatimonadota bacterium]
MKRFDVVGVGYCNVDYLGIIPRYPSLDEKMQMLEFSRQGGGVTATAMATVGRLGGRACYIGKVGDDDFGRFSIDELEKDSVDVSRVITQKDATSQFSFIAVDQATGKRTIFWTPSGIVFEAHDVCREDVLSGKVLHVDAHHPNASLQAAKWANEAGIPVVMDAGTLRPGSEEIVEHTDALITSALFAKQYTGEDDPEAAARKMFGGQRKIAAVTLGDKGCYYATADGIRHQPAFKVDVVDTTGAGDVFHGAFSFGLAQGWEYPAIIEFASAVSAIKCTKLGGRAGIPTLPEVRRFLDDRTKL